MSSYFTRDELLQGREVANPLTQEMSDNLDKLIEAIDKVRHAYGKSLKVSSGYRPAAINAAIGGSKASAHMTCQAVDLQDKDGEFAKWCLNNLTFLKDSGILSVEDPSYTKGWVHLSTRPTKSGKMVFIP